MTDLEQKPRLRFKGFTEAWEQRKILELFKVTRGYVLAATQIETEKTNENPYPVYSSQTKDKGLMGYYKDYLYEDAITWTTDGANAGTVNYRTGKFYCTNVCGVLLSNEGKANLMIAEALNKVAKGYVSYVGNPKLMNNVMADIVIRIPTHAEEQEKLSSLFANLNHLITLHQRKYEKLKSMKAALLEKMFPSENETTPKIRFKGFTEAWEQRKLGDIFEFERPDKYMIKDDHYEETGIPVLTANKTFILGYKNETGAYSKGDCIIFDDFTLDSKYVDFPYKINSSVIKILTLKDNSNLKFDYYLLNQAKILQQGHARHYISVVQPTIVNVPKKCESNKIEKLFTNLDSLITLHQRKQYIKLTKP